MTQSQEINTESQKINDFFNSLLKEAKSSKEVNIVSMMRTYIDENRKPIEREVAAKEIEDQKRYFQYVEELHKVSYFSETHTHSKEELKLLKTLKGSLEKSAQSYKAKTDLIKELITNVEEKRSEEQRAEAERLKEQKAQAIISTLNPDERAGIEKKPANLAASETPSATSRDNAANETTSTASRDNATEKGKNNATNETPGTSPRIYSRWFSNALNSVRPAMQLAGRIAAALL